MVQKNNGSAAVVWNIYPDKTNSFLVTPLVEDRMHPDPKLKLPGGRGEGTEMGPQTASRENLEEVGINIPTDTLRHPKWELVYPEQFKHGKKTYTDPRKNHDFYAYYMLFEENQVTLDRGEEGEYVEVHPLNHILNPYHPLRERMLGIHVVIMEDNFVFKIAEELKKTFPEFFTKELGEVI